MKKTVWLLASLLALCLFAASAFAQGQITGKYAITGWEPGVEASAKPSYEGEAEIVAKGNGYSFTGVIDGVAYSGSGLYDPDAKSLGFVFTSEDRKETGLAMLIPGPSGFSARWVRLDDPSVTAGSEIWTPVN